MLLKVQQTAYNLHHRHTLTRIKCGIYQDCHMHKNTGSGFQLWLAAWGFDHWWEILQVDSMDIPAVVQEGTCVPSGSTRELVPRPRYALTMCLYLSTRVYVYERVMWHWYLIYIYIYIAPTGFSSHFVQRPAEVVVCFMCKKWNHWLDSWPPVFLHIYILLAEYSWKHSHLLSKSRSK